MNSHHVLWVLQTGFWMLPAPHHSALFCFSSRYLSYFFLYKAMFMTETDQRCLQYRCLTPFCHPLPPTSYRTPTSPTHWLTTPIPDNRQRGQVDRHCGQGFSSQSQFLRHRLAMPLGCWLTKVTLITSEVVIMRKLKCRLITGNPKIKTVIIYSLMSFQNCDISSGGHDERR